jgi:hypothetical protein
VVSYNKLPRQNQPKWESVRRRIDGAKGRETKASNNRPANKLADEKGSKGQRAEEGEDEEVRPITGRGRKERRRQALRDEIPAWPCNMYIQCTYEVSMLT